MSVLTRGLALARLPMASARTLGAAATDWVLPKATDSMQKGKIQLKAAEYSNCIMRYMQLFMSGCCVPTIHFGWVYGRLSKCEHRCESI